MIKDRKDLQAEPETDSLAEKKAVALKYDPEQNVAPKMVAKGRGHVAENILAAAQKNAIPVYQNKSLVNMLMALELEVPRNVFGHGWLLVGGEKMSKS